MKRFCKCVNVCNILQHVTRNWPSTLTRLHKSEVKDGPASPDLAASDTSATCRATKTKNGQSRLASVQSKGWNDTCSYHTKNVQKQSKTRVSNIWGRWCEATPRRRTQDHATWKCWFVVLGSLSAATFENIAGSSENFSGKAHVSALL